MAAFEDNYNLLLPILPPLDSNAARSERELLDNVIKKASIVAERHQNSKWLDDSYILLGKARLYIGQTKDGIEALRYIFANGRDENGKNKALVWLMRAYVETSDYTNALNVSEYLRQQDLDNTLTRDFYLTKAYLHQRREEYLTAVAILEETFPILSKNNETARLHFIAAQLYTKLGQYALANTHLKAVNRNRPGYDLSFYTKMRSLENEVRMNPSADLNSVGFERMLRDRKNNDLKDRIYYTMGILADQRGRYPEAIGYFRKSIETAGTNTERVPYTYLELARVHYEKLERYELAKAYYDSALVLLPQNSEVFKSIYARKVALDQYALYAGSIRTEDSLQALANLSPAALDRKLDAIIEAQERQNKRMLTQTEEPLNATPTSPPLLAPGQKRWFLYDPAQANQGKTDFLRTWGNRALEDNWRRSTKESRSLDPTAQSPTSDPSVAPQVNSPSVVAATSSELKKGSPEWQARKEQLKGAVPVSAANYAASERREEEALFKLGKVYRFDLNEPAKAVTTFNRLLADFPKTEYRDEVYYLIYLCLDESDKNKPLWKERLVQEFPESPFTKLLTQTSSPSTAAAGLLSGSASQVYERLLSLYLSSNYSEALAQVENALVQFRGDALEDKFALLRLFLVGKARGRDLYLKAINEFLKQYPKSTYLNRVQEMLDVNNQTAIRRKN